MIGICKFCSAVFLYWYVTNMLLMMFVWPQAGPGHGKEWGRARRARVWEKWSLQKMCVERETLTFYAMFLDVTDPLDFKRLISAGNPSKRIHDFCWSTFTYLASPAWVKMSEISSICKYISVVSVAVAVQLTLASHTSGFSVLSDR